MKKKTIVSLTLIMLIISTLAFNTMDQPPYKNLKILPQDISKEKLDSIMHNFSQSLGVKCSFCHLRNEQERKSDFASDSLADKLIARKMMLMTMDINKNFFKPEEEEDKNLGSAQIVPEVGCYTCHRGAAIPIVTPPPPPPRAPWGQGLPVDSSKRNQWNQTPQSK